MWTGSIFAADVESFAMMAKARLEALVRQSIQEVCARVVWTTPVLTGFLRASWQPGIGAPPAMPNDQGKPSIRVTYEDGVGEIPMGQAMAQLSVMVAQLKPGVAFYYVNNARYAARLEHGFVGRDRSGTEINQRGRHWVRDAVSQWKSIVGDQAQMLSGSKQ